MLSLRLLLLGTCAVVSALPSALSEIGDFVDHNELAARQGSFYSSNWNDGTAKVNYKSGSGGSYSVTWSGDKGNFVCGKGYNPGGAR
jgi:endo-1,4-beta-xylanase